MYLLISILLGLALVITVWGIYGVFNSVPDEDRSYLDRPPFGLRLIWPLVRLVVHYAAPLLSLSYRLATQARLRKAGVDYMLSAEQFFAARVIAGMVTALLSTLVLSMLELPVISSMGVTVMVIAGLAGSMYPEIWLRETTMQRERQIFKTLPFFLDIITLAVEAGTNLTGAFTQAVQRAPEGPLRREFARLLRDVRAGKSRAEAMRAMADRIQMECINSFVSSMVQAERVGSSLGQVLRAQGDQRRSERFLRAEKQAMEAPVKLLGPLIMFIFPTTFMVIAFVLVFKAAEAGVITWETLQWALSWPGST